MQSYPMFRWGAAKVREAKNLYPVNPSASTVAVTISINCFSYTWFILYFSTVYVSVTISINCFSYTVFLNWISFYRYQAFFLYCISQLYNIQLLSGENSGRNLYAANPSPSPIRVLHVNWLCCQTLSKISHRRKFPILLTFFIWPIFRNWVTKVGCLARFEYCKGIWQKCLKL